MRNVEVEVASTRLPVVEKRLLQVLAVEADTTVSGLLAQMAREKIQDRFGPSALNATVTERNSPSQATREAGEGDDDGSRRWPA